MPVCATTRDSAAPSPCARCRTEKHRRLQQKGAPARHFRDAPGNSSALDAKETLVRLCLLAVAIAVAIAFGSNVARADGSGDPTAVKQEDGKYLDKEGNPTYKIQPDGSVDWYTYSGYRRYHSECHVG